jgi:multiple antibiotic resistance protein
MIFSFQDSFSAFMVLFAIIDIVGSIPIIIDIKKKTGDVQPLKTSLFSLLVLFIFLFLGDSILTVFGINVESFAIAGSFIIFFLAMEMVLNIEIFKQDSSEKKSNIVPLVFPLIAGAGSITTLISLKAEYSTLNISIAIILNIIVVYFVLRGTNFIEKMLGQGGILILRKIFGIILLSIAIKLFISNTGIIIK